DELSSPRSIDLDASGSIGTIDQPAIGRTAVCGVESDRRQVIAGVGFPPVDASVSIAVFLGRGEHSPLVVLDARNLSIAPGRGLDPLDRTVGARIRPGVRLAVVGARGADLLELLIGAVVLPAIDPAILVLVDLDADDARAVHVAPGVDRAVAVRVVL